MIFILGEITGLLRGCIVSDSRFNTIGFFLWGYLKNIMYQEQLTTPDNMRMWRMACTSIPVTYASGKSLYRMV